jgi:hypothetical protein
LSEGIDRRVERYCRSEKVLFKKKEMKEDTSNQEHDKRKQEHKEK